MLSRDGCTAFGITVIWMTQIVRALMPEEVDGWTVRSLQPSIRLLTFRNGRRLPKHSRRSTCTEATAPNKLHAALSRPSVRECTLPMFFVSKNVYTDQ